VTGSGDFHSRNSAWSGSRSVMKISFPYRGIITAPGACEVIRGAAQRDGLGQLFGFPAKYEMARYSKQYVYKDARLPSKAEPRTSARKHSWVTSSAAVIEAVMRQANRNRGVP
jgi:hypothetical protein